MLISVLIVTRKYHEADIALKHSLLLNSNEDDSEILVGEGDNPSLQRNKLAEEASGEYLLFLDNDSNPSFELLKIYGELARKNPEIKIFGGPSLLYNKEDEWNKVLQFFFNSSFGIGPFKSRYNPIGGTRLTDEKELILSNLFIQKEYFLKTGGFDKNFYPGEENEYLNRNRVQALYSPEACVYRAPRENISEFIQQMFSYGKGRAKHLAFRRSELMFLGPGVLVILVVVSVLNPISLFVIPVSAYLVLIISLAILELGFCAEVVLAPFVFGLAHVFYGVGIWTGIIQYKILRKTEERAISYFRVIKLKSFLKV